MNESRSGLCRPERWPAAARRIGLACGFAVAAVAAVAQDTAGMLASPVVVELYTAQGCPACPPADALLAELAPRDDVIALALHVDYWDYIGWADAFASPAFTARQESYARVNGLRSVYTPQMIVAGVDVLAGAQPEALADALRLRAAQPQVVALRLARDGARLRIEAQPLAASPGRMDVQLVRYVPEARVEIRGGENAGRSIMYRNIVTEWRKIGEWSGVGRLSMQADAPGPAPAVVILQLQGPGQVVEAARLR